MSSEFNVNEYWLDRGRTYMQERLPHDYHRLQEQFLLDVLVAGQLPLDKILELGCGFGRITRLLAESFARAAITAVDLSPEQLANARRHCAGLGQVSFHCYDFYSGRPFPGSDFDTAIAVEVFLHHPEKAVLDLFARLAAAARYIVNIDWSEPWPWPTPEHVWVHDYPTLYQQVGLTSATFVLPRKVDGLQHKLFIAGKQLPPAVVQLVRQQEAAQAARPANLGATSAEPSAALPPTAEWARQLQGALELTRQTVPTGATLILIDNDQWGRAQASLTGLRVLPFLEHDGQYWGPPADDETAIRELERLRRAGAGYLAIGWNAFWWLEHYRGFHEHLRQRHACLCSQEPVMIFKLQ